MKKTVLSLALVMSAALLVACNEKSPDAPQGEDAPVPAKTLAAEKSPTPLAAPAAEDPAVKEEKLKVIARTQVLLRTFKTDLKAALGGAMKEAGPVAAIDACQLKAPELAEALSKNGVKIGRTSHKLRNPKNIPPAWVTPLLKKYLEAPSDKSNREVVLIDDKRAGYVEAIHVETICLTCHGKSIPKEVSNALKLKYPQDQATGFSKGDFRGLFWVELPRKKAS